MSPLHELIHSVSGIHNEEKVHLISNRIIFGDEIAFKLIKEGYEKGLG